MNTFIMIPTTKTSTIIIMMMMMMKASSQVVVSFGFGYKHIDKTSHSLFIRTWKKMNFCS